jgi:PAS domain S-box-containing protein
MVRVKPLTSLRTSLITALLTAAFFILLFLYLGFNLRQYTYEGSIEIAKETSRKAAIETEEYFNSVLKLSQSMGQRAIIIKELGGTRQQVRDILLYELKSNPSFLGTWTLWEPNAFDGKDYLYTNDSLHGKQGVLGGGFFMYNNTIHSEIMTQSEYHSSYYAMSKGSQEEIIVEPYRWTYSGYAKTFFGTSLSSPLIVNDSFLGAIGVDIDLVNLNHKLSKVRLYKSGYLSLIASNGVIVTHIDTSFITKNFYDLTNDPDSVTFKSIIRGEELVVETTSEFTGDKVFRFFYPFNIGSGRPWCMMVEIPIRDATLRSNQLIVVSLVILFAGLGLILFLAFNIFDRLRYEKAIVIAMNEIEKRSELAAQNEQNYREIFNSTNEAIFIHNADTGKVIDVNDVMLKMYGYDSKEEVIQLSISDFSSNQNFYNQESAADYIVKAGTEGPQVFEWHAKNRNGNFFWVEVSLRSTKIGGEGRALAVVRDITERKRAEEALRKSQQLFETLAQIAPVGIFRTRADGYTIYVNPKWSELSGLSFDEALGDGWLNAVHPDERALLSNTWHSKVERTEQSAVEYRFLKPDGTIVWVLGNAVPDTVDGKINGYIGTITNITDLKLAQENLMNSEKKFRDLAEMLPQTIWETDISGKVNFVNKNGLTNIGYSEDEDLSNFSILDALVPEDRSRAMDNIKERLRGTRSIGEEYEGLRKDGTRFPVQIYSSLIVQDGKPIGIRGITIDMTEIKKAQKEIRESEERYRTMIDAFPDIIMISNVKGIIIFGNNELERITGITSNDYNHPNSMLKIHPDDLGGTKAIVKDLLDSKDIQSQVIENRVIGIDGNIHWFSGTISKIRLNNRICLQTVARDITEKKKIDEELERYRDHLELIVKDRTEELEAANEELTSINEEVFDQKTRLQHALSNLKGTQNQLVKAEKMASLGTLASGIAHEINNPLNFIQGGIIGIEKFIQETLPQEIVNVEPLIFAIKEGVRRSTEIVKSLNHYTRKDNQPKGHCNIHSILDNCLLIIQGQLPSGIIVKKDYSSKVGKLICNEGKLHQAFLNIFINAVQAIEDKGVIEIITRKVGSKIQITIFDTGCGVREDNFSKITDPFFTTKDPGEGAGLGLSISLSIIDDHNGSLEFESEEGKGTKVIVLLPINSKKNE